jgi:hypothetical protein
MRKKKLKNKKFLPNGGFTLDIKSMSNENLGGIVGGTQCQMGHTSLLSEC